MYNCSPIKWITSNDLDVPIIVRGSGRAHWSCVVVRERQCSPRQRLCVRVHNGGLVHAARCVVRCVRKALHAASGQRGGATLNRRVLDVVWTKGLRGVGLHKDDECKEAKDDACYDDDALEVVEVNEEAKEIYKSDSGEFECDHNTMENKGITAVLRTSSALMLLSKNLLDWCRHWNQMVARMRKTASAKARPKKVSNRAAMAERSEGCAGEGREREREGERQRGKERDRGQKRCV